MGGPPMLMSPPHTPLMDPARKPLTALPFSVRRLLKKMK